MPDFKISTTVVGGQEATQYRSRSKSVPDSKCNQNATEYDAQVIGDDFCGKMQVALDSNHYKNKEDVKHQCAETFQAEIPIDLAAFAIKLRTLVGKIYPSCEDDKRGKYLR